MGEVIQIQNLIYNIRGYKIMLDSDLAMLYEVETKVLNQAVKRNIKRFPEHYMFQLTKEEWQNLRSQFVTFSKDIRKYTPYAFTEQGIYMLMTVLKGELATKQSIALIRIFKRMKDYIIERNNYLSYDKIIDIAMQYFRAEN